MDSSDSITVTTIVDVDPDTAFRVFTEEVDAWWRHGPRFRFLREGEGRLHFEPGVGGRFIERADEQDYVVGSIRIWEPGRRLVFSFRARAFLAGEQTEVEVRFDAIAEGTRVTVEHRAWSTFAPDHPARHGLQGPAFTHMIGGWWSQLLVAYRFGSRGDKGA